MRPGKRKLLVWICWLLFCAPAAVRAQADTNLQTLTFIDGVRHYETKNYPAAIDAFKRLVSDGVRNGKLFYNLGNAFLKQGDIGPAVLWYERAKELIPGDPDLHFNLTYARSLVKDEDGETASPVFQVLFFWRDMFRPADLQWAGIGFNAMFWLLLGINRMFSKKALRSACVGALLFSIVFLGTSGWRAFEKSYHPKAVILPASVAVRSGFSPESTELFVLHGGTKVAVEKKADGFLKIRFSKDKIGWITDTAAGII